MTKDWGAAISVNYSQLATFPKNWIGIQDQRYIKDSGEFQAFHGWVALDTLVPEGSLNVVTGCWPIAHLNFEMVELGADLQFRPDGSFVDASTKGVKGRAYYSQGIAEFITDKKESLFVIGYDSTTKKVYNWADGITETEYFDPAQLQGCGPEPTVAQDPLAQPATTKSRRK